MNATCATCKWYNSTTKACDGQKCSDGLCEQWEAKTMDESTKRFASLTQVEVAYTPVSITQGKACANCRWFRNAYDSMGDACQIVDSYPEAIVSNGYCNRHEVAPSLEPEPEIDEEDSGAMEAMMEPMEEVPDESGFMALGKALWARLTTPQEDGFMVFKGTDNRRYWVAKYTNNFKDREDEYFTDLAHDDFVNKVTDGTYPMPELWTYHTRNTRHGVAERVWKSGGFVFALGSFDDTPEAQKAYAFYRRNRGKIKLSHGFYYPSSAKQDGVYHQYRTFEISTLPAGVEANPYTDFQELDTMALNDSTREWVRNVLGDDALKRIETLDTRAASETDSLKAQGVDYKGLGLPVDDKAVKTLRDDYDKLSVKLADMETKLQTAQETEQAAKQLVALLTPLTTLTEGNEATQKALAAILQKQAEIDLKLAEFADLKPASSKTSDTLLTQRETTFLGTIVNESKAQDGGSSFLDKVLGQTAITES